MFNSRMRRASAEKGAPGWFYWCQVKALTLFLNVLIKFHGGELNEWVKWTHISSSKWLHSIANSHLKFFLWCGTSWKCTGLEFIVYSSKYHRRRKILCDVINFMPFRWQMKCSRMALDEVFSIVFVHIAENFNLRSLVGLTIVYFRSTWKWLWIQLKFYEFK